MSAASFFKTNEKVIMVVLLAVIAPLFAFTGVISMVVGAQRQVQFTYRGEEVYYDEIQAFQNKMNTVSAINNVRRFGSMLASDKSPRFQFNLTRTEDAENLLLLSLEAKRQGITVSLEDRNNYIREVATDVIAQYSVWQKNPDFNPTTDAALFQAARENTSYRSADYQRAMNDSNFISDISIKFYEECVTEILTAQKLLEAATLSATVSDKEVYDAYKVQYPRLGFEYVKVDVEPFEKLVEAATLTEDEKREAHDVNLSEFIEPSKVSIEAAVFDSSSLVPTEEELQTFYEKIRDKGGDDFIAGKPVEGQDPVYKDLTEVRVVVLERYKFDEAKKIVDVAHEKAGELNAKGAAEGFQLIDAFDVAHQKHVKIVNSGLFEFQAYSEIPEEIQNIATLNTISLGYSGLEVGDLSVGVVPQTSGPFFYRITEKVDKEKIEFDDADPAKLIQFATKARALVLAKDKLAVRRKQILEGEGDNKANWQDLEDVDNYTIQKIEPITNRETSKIKFNGIREIQGFLIFNAVSKLQNVGDLTEPIVPLYRPKSVYMARYTQESEPDSAGYAGLETRLRQNLLRTKQSEASLQLLSNLESHKKYAVAQTQ